MDKTSPLLHSRIFLSMPQKWLIQNSNSFKKSGLNYIEGHSDEKSGWLLVKANHQRKPFHLIISEGKSDNVEEEYLYKQARSDARFEKLPLVFLNKIPDFLENSSDPYVFSLDPSTTELPQEIFKILEKSYPDGLKQIKIDNRDKHTIYHFPSEVSEHVVSEFKKIKKDILSNKENIFFFNFKITSGLKPKQIRDIFLFLKDLKENKVIYGTINLTKEQQSHLKQRGISEVFNIFKDYKQATANYKVGVSTKKKSFPRINVNIVNPFINSTIHTFEKIFSLKLNAQAPINKKIKESKTNYAAVIDFLNVKDGCKIALIFNKESFLKLIIATQKNTKNIDAKSILNTLHEVLESIFKISEEEIKSQGIHLGEYKLLVLVKEAQIQKELGSRIGLMVNLTSKNGDFELMILPKTSTSV